MDKKYVIFLLDQRLYAIDILDITSIEEIGALTPVPRAPGFIKGIVNLRGQLIPVISLRYVFGENTEGESSSTILIINLGGKQAALLVDEVIEIHTPESGEVGSLPELARTAATEYAAGVIKSGERIIIVIDTEQLLSKVEAEEVDAIRERYCTGGSAE